MVLLFKNCVFNLPYSLDRGGATINAREMQVQKKSVRNSNYEKNSLPGQGM